MKVYVPGTEEKNPYQLVLSLQHLGRAINGQRGADIVSAATINLETSDGELVDVTGTTTITAITLSDGHECTVRFTGILTLTNSASLVLPGAANITTAAGDFAVFRGYAAGVVRCSSYTKKNGQAVVGSTGTGDVVGPASAVDSSLAAFDGVTGKLIKDGGISATALAAALGAWTNYTPTTTPGSGSFTTLGTQTGRYVQLGKIVIFKVNLPITTNGTAAGNINFTLPVTAAVNGTILYGAENTLSGKLLNTFVNTTTVGRAIFYDGTYPGANGAVISVSGVYEAA